MRTIIAAACLVIGVALVGSPAPAQPVDGVRASEQRAGTRPRIRVTPSARLVRQCTDWYTVEPRASGPTVVPNSRCWWAYR